MPNRLIAALACACTTACASGPDEYPSLAIRDAERVSGTLQPVEPYVPPPVSAEVMTSIESLVEQAATAYDSYRGKLGTARSAARAASGAGVGSDAWAAASVAIAALETDRSRVMIALADLDRLYVAAATEGGALEDLAAAQHLVGEMAADQTAAIDEILSTLR